MGVLNLLNMLFSGCFLAYRQGDRTCLHLQRARCGCRYSQQTMAT